MKPLFLLLFVLICQSRCIGQVSKTFYIKEVYIKDTLLKKSVKDFKRKSLNFYEDDKYIVRKTCSGEWGGRVFFKDKKTGIEYSCSATCPVVINKMNGKYIITATLNHDIGSTEIIEIKNPKLLAVSEQTRPAVKTNKNKIKNGIDDECGSIKGSKLLVDTTKICTVASFINNGELYHVITNNEKTYIAKIANDKLIKIGKLSDKSIMTNEPEVVKTTDGHSIVFFRNAELEGYIDIYNNKITLFRYR